MKKNDALTLISVRGTEVIRFGQLIAPEGVMINHKVKFGGGSFTDGKNMETGLFEFMVDEAEDELNPKYTPDLGLYSLKGLTAHEYGHVWFTKFSEFKKFQTKMITKFEAEGIIPALGGKIAAHVFNITEDGRIERRMGNMYPGLVNYFRYNNGIIWQMDPEQVPSEIDPSTGVDKKELDNFLRCLITYSVVGLRPRWYKGTKGSELRDQVENVIPFIDNTIKAPTCRKCCDITEELFEACWDYLIKLLKQLQDDEERLEEYLSGEAGAGAGAGGAGDFGEGTGGAGDGTAAGDGDVDVRLGGMPGMTGDNSGSSYSSDGSKNEDVEYSDTDEMSTDEAQRGRGNITHDGGGSTKVIKSKETLPEAPNAEEMVKSFTEDVKTTASKEATASSTTETSSRKKESTVGPTMTSEEVSRMEGEVGYDREHIRTYIEKRDKYSMCQIPEDLRPTASRFKRKVQRCFKEKNTKITKMTSGKLDMRLLHKVAMDEYNVFAKDLNKSAVDAVVEICWDGSGSMYGGKQNYSGKACAVIEEGLKGLVPLKIINFSTDWNHVIHYQVKDFDENSRSCNYAWSYTKSKGFNGGNKDGYSIRVCTQDLLKRPEKDKILIVMSDGLPTDYNSINPEDDVKDAVKAARKKGVIVIPIFFGDEYFRESSYKDYEYMYEKFIINSAPEELPDRLVKLFEKVILR